jgi:predicted transposase YbfD/YdcC
MSEKPDQSDIDDKTLHAFHGVEKHFDHVDDYRRQGSIRHGLPHIIFFTLCAMTAGANDLVGVATWIESNEVWLTELFGLEHGVPSLSTLRITFMLLDPIPLSQCFAKWVQGLVDRSSLRGISIDGKAQRGTASPDEPNSFIHIVSAWAVDQELTLAQLKVEGKSNEITAIPKLLELIDIEGTVVTIDAMGTQKTIAEKIVDKGGDYILALKGNHSTLQAEVVNFFDQALTNGAEDIDFSTFQFEDEARGRHEIRRVHTVTDWEFLKDYRSLWKGLTTIICIESERTEGGKTGRERRYYLSSLTTGPEDIGRLIRGHWGIENGAHWILDVAFREDNQTARAGHIAENLSLIRRMSLNHLKGEKTAKVGVANKRLKAAYDKRYLLKVLGVKFSS